MQVIRSAAALAIGVAAVGRGSIAHAETLVVEPAQPGQAAPAAPASILEVVYTRPNRAMIMTGLFTFGQAYLASVGIAATSPHPGDANLWVPAIGPWLDLGARPGCPSSADCRNENDNKALLVVDGVLQTFGAIQLVGAFVWPETVRVTRIPVSSRTSVVVQPWRSDRGGLGLAAVGHF
jgi:hypothetical protein